MTIRTMNMLIDIDITSELHSSMDKEFSNARMFASCIVALRSVRVEVLGK